MANCADGQGLRELLGDKMYEDYFGETTELRSRASTSCATEFKTATSEDLERLLSNTENKNTKKTTQTWINRFNTWRESRQIALELHEMPPDELEKILQHFYAELVKNDGTDYEPESLRVMIACLDRHLKEHGATYSILKDRCFETSRKVLEGKAIELRRQGKGKQKMKADVVTLEEEELLWERGALGCSDAKTLNRTVFYTLSQHFGTRGRQEHHDIKIEELKVVKSPNGETDYVQWTEGLTKTRKGGLSKPARRIEQRMFAVGGPRCPVMLLKMMLSKRPDELKLSGPLYLTPLRKPRPDLWYSKQPVGIHTVNGYMKAIADAGSLNGNGKRYTNHSVRKVTVQKLKKAGVSSREIIAITGHKTEEDYDAIDRDDHRRLSTILSGTSRAMNTDVALQPSVPNTQSVMMTQQTTMLSANQLQYPWPHMHYPTPCQTSNPVYNYFSNCTVHMTPNSITPPLQGKENQPQRPKKARIMDSDEEL